jgi:hypothetical protein
VLTFSHPELTTLPEWPAAPTSPQEEK